MYGSLGNTAAIAAANSAAPAPTALFDAAVLDDVVFDTGVAAAGVPPFSADAFDPAVFDTGAAIPLYLGAAGQAVHYRGAAPVTTRYLGPRVLYA